MAHRFFWRRSVVGLAEPQVATLHVAACALFVAWRALLSMPHSLCVHIRRAVEVGAPPNHIGEKRRRTSDVTRFVRAGCRRCLRVAVADRCDQCASPDRLRTSRYASFHDIFIVSLSEKNQHDVSVRVV